MGNGEIDQKAHNNRIHIRPALACGSRWRVMRGVICKWMNDF